MSTAGLRDLLRGPIGDLKDSGTHAELPAICERLGLNLPDVGGSKRDRLLHSLDTAPDIELIHIAENFLRFYPPSAETRNRIQELIWKDTPCPEVPKRFRREIANKINDEVLFLNEKHFIDLLESLWVIENPVDSFLGPSSSSLRAKIERHVVLNPGDWPVDRLFEELGAYECSDRRFLNFLEGLTSSDVRPDVRSQSHFVGVLNAALLPCQAELQITGIDGGYPVYTAIAVGKAVKTSPKNLIFASHVKPDLRFSDAINNDIEIVTNKDRVLIYDRPIGIGGLTWQELQDWWGAQNQLSYEEAKKKLYFRLRDCLPENSPPQRLLFESYFLRFTEEIPALPALLPEVWLHWDPKTAQERGKDALLRFRMDFLMLLPNGVRIVLEVDGKGHYSDSKAQADPRKYAEMVGADRDLRLAGYDVYRFGGAELDGDRGLALAGDFFERLFKLYKVPSGKRMPAAQGSVRQRVR